MVKPSDLNKNVQHVIKVHNNYALQGRNINNKPQKYDLTKTNQNLETNTQNKQKVNIFK